VALRKWLAEIREGAEARIDVDFAEPPCERNELVGHLLIGGGGSITRS
jgi:hypothetical protein